MIQSVISMKELLEAGVHFGHKVSHWNPKMKEYILIKRRGVHIINLQKTLILFEQAYNYVKNIAANGGRILFVGTKPQARTIVREQAERCEQYYVTQHWIGGLLTNFNVVRSSINRIEEIEKTLADENAREKFLKRDLVKMEKHLKKLKENFGGVLKMKKLPDLVFIIDTHVERIAVHETNTMDIPICAMVDTNSNPEKVDIIIPSNDDAIRSIQIFLSHIADAINEGRKIRETGQAESRDALKYYQEDEKKQEQAGHQAKTDTNPSNSKKTRPQKSPKPTQLPLPDKNTEKTIAKSPETSPNKKDPVQESNANDDKPSPSSAPQTDTTAATKNNPVISAQAVKELRERSQAGMMECKSALFEANGDPEEAMRILKERGAALVEKKNTSREAHEGLIFLKQSDKQFLVLPIFCETDFVAKNDDFITFANDMGDAFFENGPDYAKSPECNSSIATIVTKLLEKIVVSDPLFIKQDDSAPSAAYLHTNKKVAAIVTAKFDKKEGAEPDRAALNETLHDIALQVAAMNPLALSADDISEEQRNTERLIFLKQMEGSDKKDDIKEKIVAGKLKKFFSERCLLEMPFVKEPKLSVAEYLNSRANACNVSNLSLSALHRLDIS